MASGIWTSVSGSRRSSRGGEHGGKAGRGWWPRCARRAGIFESGERWICGGIGAMLRTRIRWNSCYNDGLLHIALITDWNESERFLGSVQSP
jgi:hypothetical protein